MALSPAGDAHIGSPPSSTAQNRKRPAPDDGDDGGDGDGDGEANGENHAVQLEAHTTDQSRGQHKTRRITPPPSTPATEPAATSATTSPPAPTAAAAAAAAAVVESPAAPPTPAGPAGACGVCKAKPPKYKCPRCYLPYCSVACNKLHRETHPPDLDPQPRPKPAPPPTPAPEQNPPPADPTNPFRALDTSEALRTLFRKYPRLPAQLLEIHAATQPPREAPDKVIPASLMQGVASGRRDGWNHDVGIRNGKAALRRAKKDAGEAGEAVREYAELILHVVGETTGQQAGDRHAPSYIQRQAAREDTKLIQQLMADEQRKR